MIEQDVYRRVFMRQRRNRCWPTLLSSLGLSLRVFCSNLSPSICLVSRGRAFLNRSSRSTASSTCQQTKIYKNAGIFSCCMITLGKSFNTNNNPFYCSTCSFSLLEVRIMEARTSGSVSLGRLSNSLLSLATTGTDMSSIPTSWTKRDQRILSIN